MDDKSEILALRVHQWLNEWDDILFDAKKHRKVPKPKHFYVFTIKASLLKRLSKVYPRTANKQRIEDTGIQRKHDPERSQHIREYIFGGFPWSDLSKQKRESEEYRDLKMPGWLPTAIIANILSPTAIRGNQAIDAKDVITVKDEKAFSKIILPKVTQKLNWDPKVAPIEIIDGQHRLWAFEKDENLDGDFELPVVAFHDLDVSWQAYLFYTINIKPKKINASLAYDLYPMLRIQDWLEKSPEGAHIYKETRAQELTEVLWSHEDSPWKNRINMLGESKSGAVTQAAFVRSLIATLIKSSAGNKGTIGGIFGSLIDDSPLAWNRTQQAGFLILAWNAIADSIKNSSHDWLDNLRSYYESESPVVSKEKEEVGKLDLGFASKYSLLATDQGVRGYLHVINDMLFDSYKELELNSFSWSDEIKEDYIDPKEVTKAIKEFKGSDMSKIITKTAIELSRFDWRTSSFPGLNSDQQRKQMVFRGSGGYKELRKQLLELLAKSKDKNIKKSATSLLHRLKYVD